MFKYIMLIFLFVFSSNLIAQDNGLPVGKVFRKRERLNYNQAYIKAEQDKLPLLVIVGSSWCGPCIELKQEIIPKMEENKKLDSVVVTFVDVDEEEKLASQLMSTNTVPQVIFFKRKTKGWNRKHLIGKQSEETIENLIKG